MKLKCVKAHEDPSNGFLGIGAHGRRPIEGLTIGKEYEGSPIALVSNWTDMTTIDQDNYEFLIFNDNEEWETYDLNLFSPI